MKQADEKELLGRRSWLGPYQESGMHRGVRALSYWKRKKCARERAEAS